MENSMLFLALSHYLFTAYSAKLDSSFFVNRGKLVCRLQSGFVASNFVYR